MRSMKLKILLVLLLSKIMIFTSIAQNVDWLHEILLEGEVSMQLRLGFEYSTTDDVTSPAKGLNLRARLGYRTADFYDTNGFIQYQRVVNLVEDFRHPGGGQERNDFIADPDGDRVNQFYLENTSLFDTTLRLGRQEITLDDHRLIGNIGWRQNGQTFDGFSIVNQSVPNLTLYAGAINQVNTIALTHQDLDHLILLNAKYVLEEDHNFVLYSYFLDAEEVGTQLSRDSITYGLRASGQCADILKYDVTYAIQNDYQDSDSDRQNGDLHNRDGDLLNAFVGVIFEYVNAGIGYSRISGQDGGNLPFDTLFSTAHKFNGWADQFLDTNGGNLGGGLEDLYFQVGTSLLDADLLVRFHLFDTTEEHDTPNTVYGGDYGQELDISITRGIVENLEGEIKYAYYNESESSKNGINNPTTDEQVFWARLLFGF